MAKLRSKTSRGLLGSGFCVAAALCVAAMTSAASAQATTPTVPKPNEDPSGAPFTATAAVIVCVALVFGAASMKSRRGKTG